jgi:hypothetical protein
MQIMPSTKHVMCIIKDKSQYYIPCKYNLIIHEALNGGEPSMDLSWKQFLIQHSSNNNPNTQKIPIVITKPVVTGWKFSPKSDSNTGIIFYYRFSEAQHSRDCLM